MTIYDYLKKYSSIKLEIREILSAVLKKEAAFLISNYNKKLTKKQEMIVNELIKKYKDNWPLPYLIEKKSFYHLNLYINSNVLIPRPETELLVDLILTDIKKINRNKKNRNKQGKGKSKEKTETISIIDIGTGSGAIILSLADKLKGVKNIKFIATDISTLALKVTKTNAQILNLTKRVKIIKADLLSFLPENKENLIMVANLPYLNSKQLKEKSIEKEPKLALNGGHLGLSIYRQLLKQIKLKNISNSFLYLEINPEQKNELIILIKKNWPKAKIKTEKDLRKKIRFLKVSF